MWQSFQHRPEKRSPRSIQEVGSFLPSNLRPTPVTWSLPGTICTAIRTQQPYGANARPDVENLFLFRSARASLENHCFFASRTVSTRIRRKLENDAPSTDDRKIAELNLLYCNRCSLGAETTKQRPSSTPSVWNGIFLRDFQA